MKKLLKKVLFLLRGLGIILLTLILVIISPFVWPVYLGIFLLRPELFSMFFHIRVF